MQNFDIMTFLNSFWVWLQANPVPAMVGVLIIPMAYLVTELIKPFIRGGAPGSFEDDRRKAALALIAIGSSVGVGLLMNWVYPQLSYGFIIGLLGSVIYDVLRYTPAGARFLKLCSWFVAQMVSWAVERVTGRSSQPTRD